MIKNDVPQDTIDKLCADEGNDEQKETQGKNGTENNINIKINTNSESTSESTSESSSEADSNTKDGNSEKANRIKKNILSVGSYALTQKYTYYTYTYGSYYTYTTKVSKSNTYSGANISYQRNLNEYFAINLKSYSVSDSYNDISGVTGTLWWGANFGYKGWNVALGLGGYTEEWSNGSYTGTEIGLRLAYKWEDLALSLEGLARTTSEQEDYLSSQGLELDNYSHSTGAFNIGYRF
jgi:hypothetical protein